jgi:hypothetical protein
MTYAAHRGCHDTAWMLQAGYRRSDLDLVLCPGVCVQERNMVLSHNRCTIHSMLQALYRRSGLDQVLSFEVCVQQGNMLQI